MEGSVDVSTTHDEAELTAEQRQVLAALAEHENAILLQFDEVLRRFGIDRQVFHFSTVRSRRRSDSAEPGWCCCVNPPPDEARCDQCRTLEADTTSQ